MMILNLLSDLFVLISNLAVISFVIIAIRKTRSLKTSTVAVPLIILGFLIVFPPLIFDLIEIIGKGTGIWFAPPDLADFFDEIEIELFYIGGLILIIGIYKQLFSGEKLVHELKESKIRRENLMEMLSYELRTPLTVLHGYSELLEKKNDELDEQQRARILTVFNRNIARLERVIVDSQTMMKIEKGILDIKKADLSFSTFFSDFIESYLEILGKQIRFESQISSEGEVILEADSERLQQVFDNVLDNALKNTSEKDRLIHIIALQSHNAIKIQFHDNGSGITKENLEKIFDLYVTIPTKYSSSGTGIGLYLCREILHAHNGNIYATSKGIDQGSVFTVELPINKIL
jgi:signal transduction histidine kinase